MGEGPRRSPRTSSAIGSQRLRRRRGDSWRGRPRTSARAARTTWVAGCCSVLEEAFPCHGALAVRGRRGCTPRSGTPHRARRGRGVAHGRDGEAHRRPVSGRVRALADFGTAVWPHVCKGGRRAGVSTPRRPTGSKESTGEEPTGADTAAPTTAGDSSGGDGSATSGETDGDGCICAVRHSTRGWTSRSPCCPAGVDR